MNIIRWIFGIPIAVLISLGLLSLVALNIDERARLYNYRLYIIVHAAGIIFAFILLRQWVIF